MALPIYQPIEPRVLWRVPAFGTQRVPAGRPYWWTNHARQPAGTAILQATIEGEAVLDDAAGRHVAPAGSVMLFVFGEPTSYGRVDPNGPAYACQWINVLGAGVVEHIDALRQRHGPVLQWPAPATFDRILREMNDLIAMADPGSMRHSDDPAAVASAVHAFFMRLFELSRQSLRQATRPVDWAVEQMMRQATRPWSLKQYADHFGVTREHLSRTFRARTGKSPHAWIAEVRLKAAMRLLGETGLSIRQVARQAGFHSPHHLTRSVRAATGRTPTQVRAGQARSGRPGRSPRSAAKA
jgi:AraC-like DNA-binding protein